MVLENIVEGYGKLEHSYIYQSFYQLVLIVNLIWSLEKFQSIILYSKLYNT